MQQKRQTYVHVMLVHDMTALTTEERLHHVTHVHHVQTLSSLLQNASNFPKMYISEKSNGFSPGIVSIFFLIF